MSNFKTLKDLNTHRVIQYMSNTFITKEGRWIEEEGLKAEAIKIIKETDDFYEFIKKVPFKILNNREITIIKELLKWWCNLIEDDLK